MWCKDLLPVLAEVGLQTNLSVQLWQLDERSFLRFCFGTRVTFLYLFLLDQGGKQRIYCSVIALPKALILINMFVLLDLFSICMLMNHL